MSESNDKNENKIVFKKRKCISLRKRANDEELSDKNDDKSDEESRDEWNKLDELRELQRSKKRVTRGINITDLPTTQNNNSNNLNNKSDHKMGGLMDTKTLTNELDLGNTFSVETNRRDEDQDLMKYIEEELSKRKGLSNTNKQSSNSSNSKKEIQINSSDLTEEVLLSVLPEHLLKNNVKKSEEMLSNQMLNGIPEIELGIDERIRNIEATEEAKMKLMEKKKNKVSSNTSSFVPNNIAVCFVHHNRFNIEEDVPHLNNPKRPRNDQQQPTSTYVQEPVVVIGDEPKQILKLQTKGSEQNPTKFHGKEKASDDYIFEKFKKQFRKF